MEGVSAESRIGARPSGQNSASPVQISEALGGLVESAGVAEGLLHFCAKSSFGAEIFFGRRCCGSSIGAPIVRSADALRWSSADSISARSKQRPRRGGIGEPILRRAGGEPPAARRFAPDTAAFLLAVGGHAGDDLPAEWNTHYKLG